MASYAYIKHDTVATPILPNATEWMALADTTTKVMRCDWQLWDNDDGTITKLGTPAASNLQNRKYREERSLYGGTFMVVKLTAHANFKRLLYCLMANLYLL